MFEGWMGKLVCINHETIGIWKGKDDNGVMLEMSNSSRLVFFTWGMIQTLELLN